MFGSGSPHFSVRPFRFFRTVPSIVERPVGPPQVRRQARVSVVIPTLNEARNLPLVLPHIPLDVHEVILVDGASVDDTIEVARSLLPSIRIVIETERGKGAALCAGFRAAEGDIIVMLDADGSTDPTEIPRFVDALVRGADFAKGSRFRGEGGSSDISRLRALGNWGFVMLVRLLFGGRYTDLCYGYNAFWASVLPVLALDGTGFEIETMMNVRALREGLRVAEVPSYERSRIHGQSNLRAFRDGWRILRTIFRERLSRRQTTGNWDGTMGIISEAAARRLVAVMEVAPAGQLHLDFDARGGPAAYSDDKSPIRLPREGHRPRLVPVMEGAPVLELPAASIRRPVAPAPEDGPTEVPADGSVSHLAPVLGMLRASLEAAVEELGIEASQAETSLSYAVGGE
jgi:Glycosyl transferase family 2